MANESKVCLSLRFKLALLLNEKNAYFKSVLPEFTTTETQSKTEEERRDRALYKKLFGVSTPSTLTSSLEGSSKIQSRTIKNIYKTTKKLREEKLGNKYVYPDIAVLPEIEEDDFKNEDCTSEEIYAFGLKLGFVRTTKTSSDLGDNYLRNAQGVFTVFRQGVIQAIDEGVKSRPKSGCSYFLDEDDVNRLFLGDPNYQGVYAIYFRYKHNDISDCFIRATLRISYAIEFDNGTRIVRCKLNIPNINDKSTHKDSGEHVSRYQYRGRLSFSAPNHCSVFFDLDTEALDNGLILEQNKRVNPDVVNLIFNQFMSKDMLTTGIISSISQRMKNEGKTSGRREPYASTAVIIKQEFGGGLLEQDEKEYTFMQSKPRYYRNISQLASGGSEASRVANEYFNFKNQNFDNLFISDSMDEKIEEERSES